MHTLVNMATMAAFEAIPLQNVQIDIEEDVLEVALNNSQVIDAKLNGTVMICAAGQRIQITNFRMCRRLRALVRDRTRGLWESVSSSRS